MDRAALSAMQSATLLRSPSLVGSSATSPAGPCSPVVCRLIWQKRTAQLLSRPCGLRQTQRATAPLSSVHCATIGHPTVALGTRVAAGCTSAGLEPQQQEQISVFISFLLEENQKYNLTGAKDVAEVQARHVDDCLALLPALDAAEAGRSAAHPSISLLDVGSGAGLPGLLLAVCRPHWQVAMLDATKKRCGFVEAAAARMGLSNVTTIWSRAEDAGHKSQLREAFDIVTARAVAEMPVLAELCLPFVRLGGQLIVAKGAEPQAEVWQAAHAIELLGGRLLSIELVESYGPHGQRTAVVLDKIGGTPRQYPRNAALLKKQPLL